MALSKYLFNSLQKLTEHSSWPGEYFLLLRLFSFLWSLLCDLPSLKVNQPQSGCFFKLETCMSTILGNQLCMDNFNICLGSLFLLATVFRMELERQAMTSLHLQESSCPWGMWGWGVVDFPAVLPQQTGLLQLKKARGSKGKGQKFAFLLLAPFPSHTLVFCALFGQRHHNFLSVMNRPT